MDGSCAAITRMAMAPDADYVTLTLLDISSQPARRVDGESSGRETRFGDDISSG